MIKNGGIVILAAGGSTRLGYPKQLLEMDGKSFLVKSIQLAETINLPHLVVLGFEGDRMRSELDNYATETCINLHWRKGIGSSLKLGLKNIHNQNPLLDYVIFLTIDQPFVGREILIGLQNEFHLGHNAVAVGSENEVTFPYLIAKRYFKDIMKMQDDDNLSFLTNVYGAHKVYSPTSQFSIKTEEHWKEFYKQVKN